MVLKVTKAALQQLSNINTQNTLIKVFVSSGGCSGVEWKMQQIHKSNIDKRDEIINDHLVVDAMSVFHLLGSQLDYQTSLKASEFIINNPNAHHKCGCGKSFSVNT